MGTNKENKSECARFGKLGCISVGNLCELESINLKVFERKLLKSLWGSRSNVPGVNTLD